MAATTKTTKEINWGSFQNAVQSVFHDWTALRLAAENKWGGPASDEKAEEITRKVLRMFQDGSEASPIYKDELEDVLDDWFQNELSVLVEDGSIEEIAGLIVKVFDECCLHGDLRTVMRICSRTTARSNVAQSVAASRSAEDPNQMAPPKISNNRISRSEHQNSTIPSETLALAQQEEGCEEDVGGDDSDDDDDDEMEDEEPKKPKVDADGWTIAGPASSRRHHH